MLARKIRLVGVSPKKLKPVKLTPPSRDFIWNIGQPTCPCCRMIFSVAAVEDGRGGYTNYFPESNEIIVEHPLCRVSFCKNSGRKFRYKIPSIEVTEV